MLGVYGALAHLAGCGWRGTRTPFAEPLSLYCTTAPLVLLKGESDNSYLSAKFVTGYSHKTVPLV